MSNLHLCKICFPPQHLVKQVLYTELNALGNITKNSSVYTYVSNFLNPVVTTVCLNVIPVHYFAQDLFGTLSTDCDVNSIKTENSAIFLLLE